MPSGEVPLIFDTRCPWPLEHEPVTIGVPFPPSALAEPEQACVLDGDTELYCQRQVLNTWPDGSVRWLLLDFQASLPAGAPRTLRLAYGQGPSRAVLDETGISLTEERRQVTVDTGPLRFEWRTRPLRLFETVHLDGAELVSAKEAMDFRLVDLSGTDYRLSRCKLPSVSVEAGGPLRAAVRVQGSHLDEREHASLDFDLLLTAWSGKPYVVLEYQIVHRAGEAVAELHEASFELALAARGPVRLASGAGRGVALRRGEGSLALEVPREPLAGPGMPELASPSPWLSRSDDGRGIAVAVRHALQQFPKRLAADGGGLAVGFYPADDVPLRLHQGMAKSHEVLLHFDGGEADAEAVGRRCQLFDEPLRPRLPAAWYREARAFGSRFPTRSLFHLDVALDGALDRRPRALGLLHFGDEPLGVGSAGEGVVWANNACDLAYAYLLHYARAGSSRHFAAAEAIVRHVVDVDHVHFSPEPLRDGGLAAPSVDHCGDGRVTPAHQWVEGLLAWHYLTGRQPALQAVRRVGENVLRHVPVLVESVPALTDFAAVGWALYTVSTLYRELGRPQYFEAARRLLDHLARCAAGGEPFTRACAARCSREGPCAVAIVLTGLQRYHRVSKEQRAGDLFLRELDALLAGGDDALWRQACLPRPWPDLQAAALLLEPLAFAYELTGDARYIEAGCPLARHLVARGGLRLASGPAFDVRPAGDALVCRPVAAPPSGLAVAQVVRPLLAYLAAAEAAGVLDSLGVA